MIYFKWNFIRRLNRKDKWGTSSHLLLNMEHVLKSTRLGTFCIFALITFAKVSAVNSLLVAFAVLFLAEGLFAVAALEMSLFFFIDCEDAEVARLGGNIQQYLTLLLQTDLINLDILFE
jgi:hypothetical protein